MIPPIIWAHQWVSEWDSKKNHRYVYNPLVSDENSDENKKHVQIYIYLSRTLSDANWRRDLDRHDVSILLFMQFIRQEMKKFIITMASALVLAGCVSPDQRIANCTAKGVNYDTCYLSEQLRQQSINNASLSAAYANAASATEKASKHAHHN